jgi:hypothetical protein
MRPIIVELVEYVENGKTSEGMHECLEEIGAVEVRIVAIKLLGWLKQLARTGKQKGLKFNKSYTWCMNFIRLMSTLPELRLLLELKEREIDFRSDVSADERLEIAKYVDVHHNPKLRVYLRQPD